MKCIQVYGQGYVEIEYDGVEITWNVYILGRCLFEQPYLPWLAC